VVCGDRELVDLLSIPPQVGDCSSGGRRGSVSKNHADGDGDGDGDDDDESGETGRWQPQAPTRGALARILGLRRSGEHTQACSFYLAHTRLPLRELRAPAPALAAAAADAAAAAAAPAGAAPALESEEGEDDLERLLTVLQQQPQQQQQQEANAGADTSADLGLAGAAVRVTNPTDFFRLSRLGETIMHQQ
jgi:hypothetical protein